MSIHRFRFLHEALEMSLPVRFRSVAMLLLLTVGNYKLWCWNGCEWHKDNFRKNRLTDLKCLNRGKQTSRSSLTHKITLKKWKTLLYFLEHTLQEIFEDTNFPNSTSVCMVAMAVTKISKQCSRFLGVIQILNPRVIFVSWIKLISIISYIFILHLNFLFARLWGARWCSG
jgi:hypothetical protein